LIFGAERTWNYPSRPGCAGAGRATTFNTFCRLKNFIVDYTLVELSSLLNCSTRRQTLLACYLTNRKEKDLERRKARSFLPVLLTSVADWTKATSTYECYYYSLCANFISRSEKSYNLLTFSRSNDDTEFMYFSLSEIFIF
jgi:hypothetical protein